MTIIYRGNCLGILGNLRAFTQLERLSKSHHFRRRPKKVLPWFSPEVRDRLAYEQRSNAFLNTFFSIRKIRPFWPANRKAKSC